MIHEIKQGDSYWLDIKGSVTPVDSVWDHWAGSWVISDTLGSIPRASGDLIRTEKIGCFRLQLPTSESATLPIGNYVLTVQVVNTTVDYKKEIAQDKFVVKQQGITP